MITVTTTETNGKGETKVLSTERYWEKGDLGYWTLMGAIDDVYQHKGKLVKETQNFLRIPTQEEINNYRLEKCKKDYPVGTKFKSVDTGKEWSIIESWGVFDGNVTNGCILVYNATTNTYAEIIEQSPLEKLKEYASQQYPDDTILRDRINNLNQ